ncbi:transposase-like DNA-binding protein [Thermosporothrix hazakensis]|uniref:Transposase-like DNA-binding protein n=2 Tax=Thermosporothrix hazakensis TaxID=644383 RepID=A0A326TZP1_THEHA|nr:IS4 family transposase [Thermosporothrix hazakensis]PZW18068.1 transposase-like DNA-binding protein [Thermosporothrix hazakensis]
MLNPKLWAERTFGAYHLQDAHRTWREVRVAAQMAANASASLPAQMQGWKEVIALYCLLDQEDVTFEALMQPHLQHTREEIVRHPVVLLLQDTTEVDLSHRLHVSGLGQVGNERGQGFFLQTMLVVVPQSRAVVGCVSQEAFVRAPAPKSERRSQRRFRQDRETDGWMRLLRQGGTFPDTTSIVHVGNRGADLFDFFHASRETHTPFLVRAAQNRRAQNEEEEVGDLLEQVRAWPSRQRRVFEVPPTHGRQARTTLLEISFGPMTGLPPRNEPHANKHPFPLWVIRLWEEQPPAGEEPLEWVVQTSVQTATLQEAWERGTWYGHRWVVEDSHQCLKTGCRLQQRQLQTGKRFFRLLGLLSPVAVRLLQQRDLARSEPDRFTCEVLDVDVLTVVATQAGLDPASMTIQVFWQEVARLGATWLVAGMGQQAGRPCGRAGSGFRPCLRAFISLIASVCKMCIKDRAQARGLLPQ